VKRIALLVPDMPDREALAPYLARIDAARWYSNFGPQVQALESRLATSFDKAGTVGARVVTVANATLGLELALLAHKLPARSRILVPALTFVASAASIERAGHVPVLCDVDAESWLLTPAQAAKLLKESNAAAVMPVSTYGCPQDAASWDAFAARAGLPVVLDAAGAFETQAETGRSCAVFSLHATKTLGAAEGGFIVSTDVGLQDRIRVLANFGIEPSNGMVLHAGTNAKLSEYHAAVALAGLDAWERIRERRVSLHRRYLSALARTCPGLKLQRRPEDGVYSILPVVLPEGTSSVEIARRLASRNIETRRWYCPTLERHPAFADCPVAGELRVSAMLNERLLAIPFHVFLSDEDIETVCGELARAVATG
jgi:dTDP-4-amino-4,6-dideoxygalactose transaminase